MVHQPLLPQREPAADFPQHLGLRNTHVIQVNVMLLGFGGNNPNADGFKTDARRWVVDDEHGDAATLTLVRIGNGLHQQEFGRGRRI